MQIGGKAGSSLDLGDEEDLRSLLVTFRPFVMEKEAVFANRIFNILDQRLSDDELREAARHNRESWRQALAGFARLEVPGRVYRAKDCFDLVINGGMFHDDQEKARELESLHPAMRAMIYQQTTAFMIRGVKVLHPTRNVITQALEKGAVDLT